jgi:hypothetical protein
MRLLRGVPPLTGLIYQFCAIVMLQPSAVNGPRTMDLIGANWVLTDAEPAHGDAIGVGGVERSSRLSKRQAATRANPTLHGSPQNLSSTRLEQRKQPR